MATLIAAIHVLVCLALILAVLLQSGRAADLAGAFGGAGSQTAFGPRGAATFLSKATTILAVIFMFTSLGLAVYASRSGSTGSVLEQTEQPAQGQTAPGQAPGTQPAGQPAGQTPPSQQPAPAQPRQQPPK